MTAGGQVRVATPTEWIKPTEAARRLGVSDSTIYNLVRAGELASIRVGVRALRIDADSLDDYERAHRLDVAPRTTPRRGRKGA